MKSMTIRPGEVAQAQLPRHFVRGLEVGAQRRLLDAALARRAARVDVDRHQRLGLVDHQIAAGAKLHDGLQHPVELRLHRVFREQRLAAAIGHCRVAPELHLLGVARHQHAHELVRRAPALLAVDLDFVDVARVDVADRALDQAGFLVDQRRRDGLQRVLADVVPQPQQVFAVAPDLRLRPVGAGGAHDQAHALRDVQFGDDVLEPAAIGDRGDLARNAAAARRIGHQHAEPSGERDIGGQRRALRAALLLHDLHQQDLPALDHLLDLVVAQEARLDAAIARVLAAVVLAAHRLRRRLLGDLIAAPTRFPGRSRKSSWSAVVANGSPTCTAAASVSDGGHRRRPRPLRLRRVAARAPQARSVRLLRLRPRPRCSRWRWQPAVRDDAPARPLPYRTRTAANRPVRRSDQPLSAALRLPVHATRRRLGAALGRVPAPPGSPTSAARSSASSSRRASSACMSIRRCRSATGIW